MKFLKTLLLILITSYAYPQETTPGTRTGFDEVPLTRVIQHLEQTYGLQFYYKTEWIDSLTVSFNPGQDDMASLLSELFERVDLAYVWTGSNQVIITGQTEVATTIRDDYFNPGKNGDAADGPPIPVVNTPTASEEIFMGPREIEIGDRRSYVENEMVTISGYIRSAESGEPIIGATVFENELLAGTVTNTFGYYVLTLPSGARELQINSVGLKPIRQGVRLYSDGVLDMEMAQDVIALNEIIVESERNIVDNIQTGVLKLDPVTIKSMPKILGDADIVRIALTLPGVQSVGEGANGFNVRGGGTDQNLILLDDAVIYNPNHLFGFFSAFNPDLIRSADLYKSGIQSDYGGRISSVLDIALREGNKKKFEVTGGISPHTGKLTLEGPIKKDTASFLVGLRSTYSDWILGQLDDPDLRNSSAAFSDFNTKLDYQLDHKNSISLSAYHSRDRFRLASDTLYRYFNSTAALQWRTALHDRLFMTVSGSISDYAYEISSEQSEINAFRLDYQIRNGSAKVAFNWVPSDRHNLKFGLDETVYSLAPGSIEPAAPESIVEPVTLSRERGTETSMYLGDEFELTPRLSLYGGLRYTFFAMRGPATVFNYSDETPREVDFITDTLQFGRREVVQRYDGPEYRFSMRYKLLNNLSVKFSYDRTRQFIHQLSNTTSIAPTDTWRLSSPHLKPQVGDQWSGGFYTTLPAMGLDLSVEAYYKKLKNQLAYKDGADLLVNEVLETDVLAASGKSRGIEFYIRKKQGKLNGWISYTLSRTELQTSSDFTEEQINNGLPFPADFDRPHSFSLVSNYRFNRRINASANLVYSSGRPVTFAVTKYQVRDNVFAYFPERNQLRIPDYFRIDVAINLEGNHRSDKLWHGSWSFSVYNLTGRKNAYSVFSRTENGEIAVKRLAIFGVPIPTITYNFKI